MVRVISFLDYQDADSYILFRGRVIFKGQLTDNFSERREAASREGREMVAEISFFSG